MLPSGMAGSAICKPDPGDLPTVLFDAIWPVQQEVDGARPCKQNVIVSG
jgi:hypothetical protein